MTVFCHKPRDQFYLPSNLSLSHILFSQVTVTIADMAKAVGKTGLSAYHMFLQKTTKGASFSCSKDISLKMRCRLFVPINVYV